LEVDFKRCTCNKQIGGYIVKKKLIATITGMTLIMGILLSGCGSSSTASQNGDKKYTIAVDPTYAPFEFKQGDKNVGIDLDLLSAIAKEEKFSYELKIMKFSGMIPGIQSGIVDGAVAGISITDLRKKTIDFSDPYYDSGLTAVVKSDNSKINSIADLKGKTVAVKKGAMGAKYAEDNKDKLNLTIKYFEDSPSMFLEVENGNADVAFDDYPVVGYKISQDKNSKLKLVGGKITKDEYGFIVKKGTNAELLKKFNAGLKAIKANGEYDKIIKKYINVK
jgi:glutamine transport system substrate-binding protein